MKTSRRSSEPRRRAGSEPIIRRKNLNIDQAKLDRVRSILGARTETEAVDLALSLLLLREELIVGVRRIGGTGGVENYFDDGV